MKPLSSPQQPLNIVLLTDCLFGLTGGAEKQIYELARGLDKEKFTVHVASLDTIDAATQRVLEDAGAKVKIFKVKRIYGLSGLWQGILFWIFLRKQSINVVVTYHFGSDIWGTVISSLAGIKNIYSNRRDMGFWRNGAHVATYRLINPFVKRIIVVSQSIKDMIIATEKVKARRIDVIHNGVDIPSLETSRRRERKQELGIKPDDTVIMHVANLKPVKGHEFLLKAFSDLVSDYPHLKLVLIGNDDMNGQLQQLAISLNISKQVIFLGQRHDVRALLQLADFCVLPSLSEGMSNAVLEYMSAAKAVIATNVGGNSELVQDGVNGFLVEAKNKTQLSDAMRVLLKDPDQCQRMGQESRRIVEEQFSLQTMVERYQSILGRCRVLHLISSIGFYGAERVVVNLASCQVASQVIVGALYNAHNPHLEILKETKRAQRETVVFNCKGIIDLRTIRTIRRYIKDNDIDLIHTHNYKSDFYGFLSGAPWVVTNHSWTSIGMKLKFYEMLDSIIIRFARQVVAVSAPQRDDMISKNIVADKITCIDNGIAFDQFNGISRDDARQELNIPLDTIVIVMVARLSEEKGHQVLLKALHLIKGECPGIKCLIVGDGPLLELIQESIQHYQLADMVILTGVRRDIPLIYAAADMLVNASFIEGLPMTILEAMASKVAIIATDVGAVGKVITHGTNGFLLKPGDAQLLAAALKELITDKAMRQRFANQGYETVIATYSSSAMAKAYDSVYRKALFKT